MPTLHADDSRLLDALRGLRWPAQRQVRHAASGVHLARKLGPAAELSEYRAYRQGDDPRRIDWKLLARTDRAYIRLAQQHSQLGTVLLLDASASLAWPTDTQAKWQQARRLALGLAAATHQAGDPVGLLVAQGLATEGIGSDATPSQQLHQLPARTQAGVVQQIAHLLRTIQPQGSVALAPAMQPLKAQRLVVISDFLGSDADNEHLLAAAGQFCARGREVFALHLIDAAELNPPRQLDVLHDSEAPHLRRNLNARVRLQYQQNFTQWREQLALRWRQRGAQFSTVLSDEASVQVVRRIVKGITP